jgi:hypothetical protein
MLDEEKKSSGALGFLPEGACHNNENELNKCCRVLLELLAIAFNGA